MTSAVFMAALTGGGLALASAAHCAVMCGPLALAARAHGSAQSTASYLLGRLVSYTVLGGIAGAMGRALLLSPWARWAEAFLSWLLAVTLLYTALAVLRPAAKRGLIQLGAAPRVQRLGRLLARVADDPLLLGAATALLPCGALFTALTAAASLGTPAQGALVMASFAALSGASLVGVAQLGALRTRGPLLRRALAGTMLAGALIMLVRPLPVLRAGAKVPACHGRGADLQPETR